MESMEVDGGPAKDLQDRFSDLDMLYRRPSQFAPADFEDIASNTLVNDIAEGANILVIGAGGLGCELLKDLALSGV